MKSEKSFLLCIMAALLSVGNIYGQKLLVSAGGNLAVPQSFGVQFVAGTGFGGSIRLESVWSKHVSGLFSVEYLSFAMKDRLFDTTYFKAIPVQIGIKYYLSSKKALNGFFITTELGLMPTKTHFKYKNDAPDYVFKESGLSAAPGFGYQFGKLEPSFRLQYHLSASGFNVYYLSFRLAYIFLKSKHH